MILGIIEHDGGKLNPISLQMLTYGRRLAETMVVPFHGVLIGGNTEPLRKEVASYGVSRIYLVQHPGLDDYAPEAWAKSVTQVIRHAAPQLVLVASTDRGNEILAWVGAQTGLPFAANCLQLELGTSCRLVRLRWGGSLLEEAELHGDPKLVSIAPHVFEAAPAENPQAAHLENFTPVLGSKDFRVRVTAREQNHSEGANLQTAAVVVGGGRGVGSSEGFKILEELAALIGGAVGGSRVATNNGWRPHSDQVGLTGNRIAPQLYIACGISGAIQHLVGCKGAKRVLAINKDPDAPFFRRADYGVVGDLHEILPALISEIRKRKSG
jgi:electron transfer flavoprotein alpha subunit